MQGNEYNLSESRSRVLHHCTSIDMKASRQQRHLALPNMENRHMHYLAHTYPAQPRTAQAPRAAYS